MDVIAINGQKLSRPAYHKCLICDCQAQECARSRKHTIEEMQEKIDALYNVIVSLETREQCRELFDDLCTRKEIEKMAERLYAARLLMAGNTYSQVIAQSEISSATLSRVSRCVQYGKGYSRVLKEDI